MKLTEKQREKMRKRAAEQAERNRIKIEKEERQLNTERDEFGALVGSHVSKVYQALTQEFATEKQIATAAGLSLRITRSVLYRAAENGFVLARRVFKYRWNPELKVIQTTTIPKLVVPGMPNGIVEGKDIKTPRRGRPTKSSKHPV